MTVVTGPWDGRREPLAAAPPERRASRRLRVLLAGRLFRDDATSTPCTIHDLSEAGARLSLEPPARAPAQFHLMAPKTRSGYAAQVVWREGTSVGVAFTRSYDLDDPGLEFEVRMAWLRLNAG